MGSSRCAPFTLLRYHVSVINRSVDSGHDRPWSKRKREEIFLTIRHYRCTLKYMKVLLAKNSRSYLLCSFPVHLVHPLSFSRILGVVSWAPILSLPPCISLFSASNVVTLRTSWRKHNFTNNNCAPDGRGQVPNHLIRIK